jgi:hypothetical protein
VRRALIATRLDDRMLIRHDPEPFLAMLPADQRPDIRRWFREKNFDSLATWIAPAAHLNPSAPPRVSGRVTYAVTGSTLRITTNFVWVYAFTGTPHSYAAVHDEVQWEVSAKTNALRIKDVRAYLYGMDCATSNDSDMLAPQSGPSGTLPDPTRTENPDALLRPDHSLSIPDDCH